jgi:hypothetical protein
MENEINQAVTDKEVREKLFYELKLGKEYTPEDVDYLIKTSELLNTCIDKKTMN